jgi:hypothetical protein
MPSVDGSCYRCWVISAVAVEVMNGEHRWNSVPVQQLADIDPSVTQPLTRCGGVRAGEPDAGLDTGGNSLMGRHQGDRRR